MATKRINAHRIDKYRFSVRFKSWADYYDIRTVGQARAILDELPPTVLFFHNKGASTMRCSRLKKELREYIECEQ